MPSQKLIAAQLGRDLATTARTLRRLGARKLRARRGFTATGLRALTDGAFSAKLTAQGPGGAMVLGKGTRPASGPGAHALRLKLSRSGVRKLTATGRVRIKLALEFRDSAGRRTVRVVSLRLPG